MPTFAVSKIDLYGMKGRSREWLWLARRHAPQTRNPARRFGRSRPEALGSPTGYVVPPGHCVLWPHPSLSAPRVGLWIRRIVFPAPGGEPRGSPIYSACLFVRAIPSTPVD